MSAKEQHKTNVSVQGGTDAIYSMGVIGAWIYYFSRASTTEERIKAFFKGFVWPAYLVHDLFVFLQKKPQGEE